MKLLKNKKLMLNIAIFAILPFFINFILEVFGNKSFLGGLLKLINDPLVFLCNTLIIASTISIGAILGKFRYFWISFVSIIWIILGAVNFIVISNRVSPFTIHDLHLLDTLPFITKKYLTPFQLAIICLAVIAVVLGVFIIFFRTLSAPKKKSGLKIPAIYIAAISIVTFGCVKLGISVGALETYFPELSKSFVKNGYVYSFLVSWLDNGVDRVDGYSEELIESITEKFPKSDTKVQKIPNIILVQMESFFDLNALNSVSFSSDPVPNVTRLTDENPSGLFTVPVVGAGTANTEFEVMTGMRVADFGAGEYPFRTVLIKKGCESIAYNLKKYNVTSHFIHNYIATFYGRHEVYANLGYDNFYSIEYMTDYETNENGWAKDKILLRYINECLDSTKGSDLITAISVQGHGSYNDKTDYKRYITVNACENQELSSSFEYYANQIYEMDMFIGELAESLASRNEDTVLVVYGDHLPSLEINPEDLSGRNIYQTDYFIWNNMGLEFEDKDIYSHEISSIVLGAIGVTDGVINSCHQAYGKTKDYLHNLKALEYDTLYGKKYAYKNNENPYKTSKMAINRRKITISSVKSKDGKNTYTVNGEGFSDKSVVRVGYTVILTKYINENTLEFSYSGELDAPVSIWEHGVGTSNEFTLSKTDNVS